MEEIRRGPVITRRAGLAMMAAGAAALSSRAWAAAPVEQTSIEIGGNRDPQLGAQIAIASLNGYFKDEGLDVKVHWTQVGGDLQPLLAGGAVNVAGIGMQSTIALRARKVPLKVICALCDYSGTQGLVLTPGLKLKSPADLVGKRIAVPNEAPHEMALAKLGKQYGFDARKIILVRMEPSEAVAATSKGDVDGVLTFQPHLYRLVQMGGTLYFTGTTSYISGAKQDLPPDDHLLYIHSALNANETWLAANPNTASALLRAIIRATNLIHEQPAEAQKVLQDFFHADAEALHQAMDQNRYGVAIDSALQNSISFANQWLAVNKQIPAPVNPSDILAPQLLEKIDPKLVSWKA